MAHVDEKWSEAQRKVAEWLRSKGLVIKHAGEFGDFNLCTPKMTRIRVRRAAYKQIEYEQEPRGWKVSLTNGGVMNQRNIDFFVLFLEVSDDLKVIGITRPLYVVIPSPMKQTVVTITTRHLLSQKWKTCLDNWQVIAEFDEKKPVA